MASDRPQRPLHHLSHAVDDGGARADEDQTVRRPVEEGVAGNVRAEHLLGEVERGIEGGFEGIHARSIGQTYESSRNPAKKLCQKFLAFAFRDL